MKLLFPFALAFSLVACNHQPNVAACSSPSALGGTDTSNGQAVVSSPQVGGLTAMAKKASGAEAMEKTAKAAARGDIKGAAAGAAAATPQGQAAAAAAEAAKKVRKD